MYTVDRAKEALWRKSGLPHDADGYVANPERNLVSDVTPDMIKTDSDKGSGQEWRFKIRAIHSSAALAANTTRQRSKGTGMNTLVAKPVATCVRFDADVMWVELADGRQLVSLWPIFRGSYGRRPRIATGSRSVVAVRESIGTTWTKTFPSRLC